MNTLQIKRATGGSFWEVTRRTEDHGRVSFATLAGVSDDGTVHMCQPFTSLTAVETLAIGAKALECEHRAREVAATIKANRENAK